MNTQELTITEGWTFLNSYVKAYKLMRKHSKVGDKCLNYQEKKIQILNLIYLCEILNIPYIREDWDGNEQCEANYDIAYFNYRGFEFFQLIDKEKNS